MTTRLELTETQLESFWRRVDKTGTCWNWTGGKSRTGYGMTRVSPKMMVAHRVSYQMAVGMLPTGQQLDHICHNRACVNPDHLRPVTAKQNMENLSGARKNSSRSGVRGVSWAKDKNKWRADICHNYKQMNLGYYDTVEEAAAVVTAKRNELYTHNEADRKAA